MLLCLLGYASSKLGNSTILKSFVLNLIHNMFLFFRADVMASAYVVRLSLLYLLASVGASSYENEPRFHITCDNSSMHLNVEFDNPFHGVIYTSGNLFTPQCSFSSSAVLNNTKFLLTLPFSVCNFIIGMMNEERTSISSTVVVQQHRMLRTSYDVLQNVTCEVPVPTDTFRQLYYHNASTSGCLLTTLQPGRVIETWIETRAGSDLFPDENSEELFLVVNVKDGGKSKDLSVLNCIAHDEQVLTNETFLYQMSDSFGCSNSFVLSNFTVSNQTKDKSDLMAYTQMRDLVYTVKGEFFVTCGVVLCETSCPSTCDNEANRTMHHFSDIATKRFAGRLPGATLPPSLDLFEWRQTVSKRSLRETLSRWFRLGSDKLDESLSEGITSETFLVDDQDENTTDGALDNAAILKEWDDVLDNAILNDLGTVLDNATILNELIDVLDNFTILNDWHDVLDNSTILNDLLYNATLLKDMEVTTSNILLEELIMGNGTEGPNLGDSYREMKYSIWSEVIVCVLFFLLLSCYGGILYSNSKKNLDWTGGNINELYSVVH